MDEPEILLTNDDGIESTGLRALHDALSSLGSVVAVAPKDDQSAVGRSMSDVVEVTDHELGYVIDGTPADCVVAGLEALVPGADVVVSGVNRGANLGAYVLGRSGTISAAVEAAFFDVPAIAVSLYVPVPEDISWTEYEVDYGEYGEATNAAAYLVDHAVDVGVFDHADYLNVNAPVVEEGPAPMEITTPARTYLMDAERDGQQVTLYDRIWERMATGDVPDPEGTDRRAVAEGRVSVSPLTAPHTTEHHEALDALAETYPDVDVGSE